MMAAPTGPESNVFGYPSHLRVFVNAVAVTGLGLIATALAAQGRLFDVNAILILCLLVLLEAFAWLSLRRSVTLTNEGIVDHGILRSRLIRWDEIDDFHWSARVLQLSTGSRIRLWLFGGDYGLAIEPFDALQRKLADRLLPRLTERWSRVNLPRSYKYPPLSLGVMLAYAIPFALLVLFFIVFSFGVAGFWAEKLMFLALGLAALVPFLVRDYLRTRTCLELSTVGLREVARRQQSVDWSAIQQT